MFPSHDRGALVAGGLTGGLEAAGVPEPIAEAIGLGTGAVVPKLGGVSKQLKPSGLPERRFEDLKRPRKASPQQVSKVSEAVEKDLRSAVDKVIEKQSSTSKMLKEDPAFRTELDNDFKKVQELAESYSKDTLPTKDLKSAINSKIKQEPAEGITSSETERVFRKEMRRLSNELGVSSKEELTPAQIVKQYRKNNEALSEYFESGKSKGANKGKKLALLEYNRVLADEFEKTLGDSPLTRLFKSTNKVRSEVYALDEIDDFITSITENKISFSKARQFWDKKPIKNAFNKALGKEGANEVEDIFKDFMTYEKGYKNIREASRS